MAVIEVAAAEEEVIVVVVVVVGIYSEEASTQTLGHNGQKDR